MKPYQTKKLTEGPDVGDIRSEGRKSIVGVAFIRNGKADRPWRRNRFGDYRGLNKPHAKAVVRRNMKRSDKNKVNRLIMKESE